MRRVASTKMNSVSSRSHAIVEVKVTLHDHEGGAPQRVSKLRLVDLAVPAEISYGRIASPMSHVLIALGLMAAQPPNPNTLLHTPTLPSCDMIA